MVQKDSQNDIWHEVSKTNWKFSFDELNKSIHIEFINAVKASSLKIHNNWDDRDLFNISHDNFATFKNTKDRMIRVWFLENERKEDYGYDGNSNRTGLTVDGTVVSGIEYYKNNRGGNTPMIKFDGEWYYTYDENGNRISKGKSKTEVGSSYITATATSNGAREGNVVINTSDEYWTYEWDLYNRLVKVKQFNAPDGDSCKEVSYEYDALNFRTKRTSVLEETVTEYAYGRKGALTYEKFTKNGTTAGSRTYAYLNDQIIGFTDTDGTVESKRYAVTDIQGSVNEIYDESGNLIWKSGYTAFGELAGESVDKLEGVFEFHGMYTGCQIDSETGLTYHWNRWRSEDGANFITQDPARDGSNWYGYCGQNPIKFQDPTGLLPAGPNQPPVNSSKWLDRKKGDKKGNGNESEKEAKEPPTKTPETPEQPKVGINITIPTPEIQQFGMGVLMGIEDSITHLKNVDFGRDYAYDAITEWRNGNYLQAAIYELDATSEMVLDLCFAYVGAQIVNAFIIDSLEFIQAVKAYYGRDSKLNINTGVGNPVKIAGRGSTGRIAPNTLKEQMAMHQVKSDPLNGAVNLSKLKKPIIIQDSRWKASEGWVKMSNNVNGVEIHFNYNTITGEFDDFKFKN